MKLIIEISEDKYKALQKGAEMGIALGVEQKAILNGIPYKNDKWKLIDLLSLITDYSEAIIYNSEKIIACYDGKDSIPNELNNCEIVNVFADSPWDESGNEYSAIGIEIEEMG